MKHEVAIAYPSLTLSNRITLAGAVRKYWPAISRNWFADRTITGNISDYERRILAEANPLKALEDYTAADFDLIVKKLEAAGDYKEGTTEHYRHLIRLIIDSCINGKENIDTSLIKTNESEDKKRKGLIRSLTDDEEDKMFNWTASLDAKTMTGPEIGVVMMFYLGVRNHEAAGTTFGSVHHNDILETNMLRVIMTTSGKTRNTKTKTKTPNGHRDLPVPFDILINLTKDRKKYIEEQFGLAGQDLYLMPICCSPHDYKKHCTYEEINQAAKRVFLSLGIGGNKWKLLLGDEDVDEVIEEEKDPTAYLLRRNAATRYYALGLSEAEIHYVMGHAIDTTGIVRSDYTNSYLMRPIFDKIRKHRFCE